MLREIFRKKEIGSAPVDDIQEHHLHRTLSALDLTLMGIGVIIGAGVFVLTGIAAATRAGPGVVVSYFIAGLAALFSALSYAELASSIGGTGSAYSYAYAGFGEFIAWLIGWNLLLEYVVSVGSIAIGWSGYVINFFQSINLPLPIELTTNPFQGGILNLVAVCGILFITLLLCIGVKQSARFNAVIVVIKLLTIGLFIYIAAGNVNVSNWDVFLPFGWQGVLQGAALVFFAYIGFDALSTAVEEAIDPQRAVPISIVTSLLICTAIYIAVSALLTLIVPYTSLNVQSPVADALLQIGYKTGAGLIAIGAIAGLTTVLLVMFYGLSRICLAMARDGLLPKYFRKINPNTRTPIRIIVTTGILTAVIAGFAPLETAAELINIGTLAAFVFVCIGVIVFRHTHPNLHRPFKLPFNPLFPALGIFFCIWLMLNLLVITWWRFLFWTLIGIAIYFLYGRSHSVLGHKKSK